MDFGEIFSDSFKYPLNNFKIFLIIGFVLVVTQLISQFSAVLYDNLALSTFLAIIGGLLGIFSAIFINGYLLSDLRSTIDLNDKMPEIDIKNNLIEGLKYLVLGFVYVVVCIVIFAIFAILAALSVEYIHWAIGFILLVLAFFVTIIFGMFLTIARSRLAAFESLSEALNIAETWNDIKKIGIANYIIWLIILAVIIFVIFLILFFILVMFGVAVGPIGIIILSILGTFLITPYVAFFENRALGLLYAGKED